MGTLGTLTPERWRRIQEVLDAFDELPPTERVSFLDATGREDPELRRQAEALLANDDRLDELLGKPVFPICTEKLDEGLLVPRIGPYKLIRELGHGGMGTVYLASQKEPFRRHVALKLIQPEVKSQDSVRRFHYERQILARIRHPNVAQLYDGGTTPDGRPYFAMEYIEGSPIHEYCDAHQLTVPERLRLIVQVCSAVHLAHQKLRVVHRDLKPGNILVTEDGIPKLLDFGIAKALDADRLESSEARHASVWVRHYSSPEQLAGLPLTTATDIYSLGVLLYRLLTGRLPYRAAGNQPESVRQAIQHKKPEKPSVAVLSADSRVEGGQPLDSTPESISMARGTRPGKLSRRLAGDVDAIVLKALAASPEERYSTVDRLAEDIRRHLRHFPIRARKHSYRYVFGKLVRRHRFGLAAANLILLTLALALWTVTAERTKTQQARGRAERTVELLESLLEVFDPDTSESGNSPREFLADAQQKITDDLRTDPELLSQLLNEPLAKIYRRLGHLEESETALRESLAILRNRYPGDHPLTAEVLNNLGAIRQRREDYAGAKELYRETLAMRKRLDLEESKFIGPLSNLAAIATRERRFNRARTDYLQVLEIQRRKYGAEDPKLAINYHNLGRTFFFQNDLEQAAPLLRRALELETATEGATVNAAIYHSSLARALHARGQLVEAESQIAAALEVQSLRLAPESADLARSRRNLAMILLESGELPTVEVLLTQAQSSLRAARSNRSDNWEIAELESLTGSYLTEIGDFDAAEICLLGSHAILARERGVNVIHTKQALGRIVRLYELWGKPERAAEYLALEASG